MDPAGDRVADVNQNIGEAVAVTHIVCFIDDRRQRIQTDEQDEHAQVATRTALPTYQSNLDTVTPFPSLGNALPLQECYREEREACMDAYDQRRTLGVFNCAAPLSQSQKI